MRKKKQKKINISVEMSVEKKQLNEILLARKGGRMKDKRKKPLDRGFYE
jgi:hypothetical protein